MVCFTFESMVQYMFAIFPTRLIPVLFLSSLIICILGSNFGFKAVSLALLISSVIASNSELSNIQYLSTHIWPNVSTAYLKLHSTNSSCSCALMLAPGMMLLMSRLAIVAIRHNCKSQESDRLNPLLCSLWHELFDTLCKVVNITLVLWNLANYGGNSIMWCLLMISRVILLMSWTVVFGASQANKALPTIENSHCNPINLLNSSFMQLSVSVRLTCLSVRMVGILDLTALRLLPWARSEFTDRVMGYPTMFVTQCCLYSTLWSSIFQAVASVISVNSHPNFGCMLFFIVSLFNFLMSAASVVLFVQRTAKVDHYNKIAVKAAVLDLEAPSAKQARVVFVMPPANHGHRGHNQTNGVSQTRAREPEVFGRLASMLVKLKLYFHVVLLFQ